MADQGAVAAGRRRIEPPVAAAVDAGSNSAHLLVAAVDGHRLLPLADVSAFIGLGAAVDQRGEFGPEVRRGLVDALNGFAVTARGLGAASLAIVGTDPFRRAADATAAMAEVEDTLGLRVLAITSDEEALLTLLGVMAGRPVVRDTVVVDVGGGSTQVVAIGPTGDPAIATLAIGSARLTRAVIHHDPPSPAEFVLLLEEARRVVAEAPAAAPAELVMVGGTVSNLAKLSPGPIAWRTLTRRRIAATMGLLAAEPSEAVAARFRIRATRSRILPAGAAIVAAIAEHYAVDRVRVSEAGVREGLVLAAVHAGPDWRDHLAWLAHGWSR